MKYLLLCLILTSCAGYRFKDRSNPFSQYGIRSLSIPMFYNHSVYGGVSGTFTKDIFTTLVEFKDLTIKSGNKPADAVLIGVIESPSKIKDAVVATSTKSAKNTYGEDLIGNNREDFNMASVKKMRIYLRVIVIKHPTKEEIKFLQTELGQNAVSSKIIFNQRIALEESYTLKELQGEATKVLSTQNRGVQNEAIKTLSQKAASNFKDMILYAF